MPRDEDEFMRAAFKLAGEVAVLLEIVPGQPLDLTDLKNALEEFEETFELAIPFGLKPPLMD